MLVVLNLADTPVTAKLAIPMERLFARQTSVQLKELFSGKVATLENVEEKGEMEVEMEGYGYRVYTVK